MITALKGHEAVPLCISYSPDGSRVATAGQDQTVRIWRTSDWSAQEVLKGHTGTVNWVEFSPDGSQIVSGGDDKSVRIWSSSGGEPLQTIITSLSTRFLGQPRLTTPTFGMVFLNGLSAAKKYYPGILA